jgi:hypothetical protein
LYAQSAGNGAPRKEELRWGLGIGLNPFSLAADRNVEIIRSPVAGLYVPMQLASWLRLEPEFAYYSYHDRQEHNATWYIDRFDASARFGVGSFYTWQPYAERGDSMLTVYGGGRVGLVITVRERSFFEQQTLQPVPNSGDGDTQSAVWYMGCFGMEYALSRHLSCGAEVQVGRYEFGEPQHRFGVVPSTFPRNRSFTLFGVSGVVFLRLYW